MVCVCLRTRNHHRRDLWNRHRRQHERADARHCRHRRWHDCDHRDRRHVRDHAAAARHLRCRVRARHHEGHARRRRRQRRRHDAPRSIDDDRRSDRGPRHATTDRGSVDGAQVSHRSPRARGRAAHQSDVRIDARWHRRFAERWRRSGVLRCVVARESLHRRRHRHHRPHDRQHRHAGAQRVHRGSRGRDRRLQCGVRPRDRRHRQHRHPQRHRRVPRLGVRHLSTGLPHAQDADRADQQLVDRHHRRQGLPRERRLRDGRPDHQAEAVVVPRRRTADRFDELHADHEEPDRLQKGRLERVLARLRRRQRGHRPEDWLLHHRRARPRDPQRVDEVDLGAREDQRRADRGSQRSVELDRAAVGEHDAGVGRTAEHRPQDHRPQHRHRRPMDREVQRRQDRGRSGDRVAPLDGQQRCDRSDAGRRTAAVARGRQPQPTRRARRRIGVDERGLQRWWSRRSLSADLELPDQPILDRRSRRAATRLRGSPRSADRHHPTRQARRHARDQGRPRSRERHQRDRAAQLRRRHDHERSQRWRRAGHALGPARGRRGDRSALRSDVQHAWGHGWRRRQWNEDVPVLVSRRHRRCAGHADRGTDPELGRVPARFVAADEEPHAQRRHSLRGAATALRREPARHDRSTDRQPDRRHRDGSQGQLGTAARHHVRPDE